MKGAVDVRRVFVSSAMISSPQQRVKGVPPTQGDKFVVGGRVIEQKDARLKVWRRAIAYECQRSGWTPIEGPVSIRLLFSLPRPRSHYGTGRNAHHLKPNAPHLCATKPDADKLARAVLDALTQCGAIGDDANVVQLTVEKWYVSEATNNPGVLIHATPITGHNA